MNNLFDENITEQKNEYDSLMTEGLTMSSSMLYDTVRFIKSKGVELTPDTVKRLDAIWQEISTRPQNLAVFNVYADDKELIRTLNDLHKKSQYIGMNKKDLPLSLSNTAKVASRYLSAIGAPPAKNFSIEGNNDRSDKIYFTDTEGNEITYLSFDTSKEPPYGYVSENNNESQKGDASSCKNKYSEIESEFYNMLERRLVPFSSSPCLSSQSFDLLPEYKTLCANASGEKSYNVCAKLTEDSSFTGGINIALDTLFELLAKGADRGKVTFAFKYFTDPKNAEKSLEAMLGTYRIMIELGIADCESKSESVSKADRTQSSSVFCAVYAEETEQKNIANKFSDAYEESDIYLLTFNRIPDSSPHFMPDFESLRNTLDTLKRITDKKGVLSIKAFNGPLSEELTKIIPDSHGIEFKNDADADNIRAQGFIIQAIPERKIKAKYIGKLKKLSAEKEEKENTTDGN